MKRSELDFARAWILDDNKKDAFLLSSHCGEGSITERDASRRVCPLFF